MGVAIIVAVVFDAGSPQSKFGFVPLDGFSSVAHDVFAVVCYILGGWLVRDALIKSR